MIRLSGGRMAMKKKAVVFIFSLFSMTLFCAEKSPIGGTSKLLGIKRKAEEKLKNTAIKKSALESRYEGRRNRLVEEVKSQYPDVRDGVIVLFSNFEIDIEEFQQEHNFYYLTDIKEPGTLLLLDFSGESVLYIPAGLNKRNEWIPVQRELLQKDGEELGFNEIVELGSDAQGPLLVESNYFDLCRRLSGVTQKGGTVFTLQPLANTPTYSNQVIAFSKLEKFVPDLCEHVENILSILFSMRQVKDGQEIACLRKAIDITIEAQIAAAHTIRAGKTERDVRAAVEGTMFAKSRPGFCSIIGSGVNATFLHHPASDKVMHDGELVVVDIGAKCGCDSYSGDLTRVYPVSGKFSQEQRNIYSIVFGALQCVVENAKPGYYFINKEDESKSLFHIAKKFFKKYNYDEYFTHGVGHHIGLNVHEDCAEDRGTYYKELQDGNAVALEPGLYFPKKGLGVRIEGNYLIREGGAVCLDEALPKDLDEIEKLMQKHTA